ncbi:multidrug efflux SMR transporter [Variovorax sp. PCZ-1]|uniref:DMT family transporter n=1 Tax=Variovorax sp. PCZ-1 TaxID=2835533 RepID=UPI001BCBB83C|nr:multidrug efflux SMR transporter [Variovorax sp. PCZ-1]MBS7807466.1 multidrug efflux SMR transporter [Variovorax sp. PCZ-1]
MLKAIQAFTPTLSQAWTLLAIAITFEVMGTTCMKLSQGFTRPVPSVAMFAFYALAFTCNTMAIKTIDLSVTYAVWSGVGTIATALIGIYYFKEAATAIKLASISLIVIGVFGLHAASRMQVSEKPVTANSAPP